jgi:hypothetical protein
MQQLFTKWPSFEADKLKEITEHCYMPTFKAQGKVYHMHMIESLFPMASEEPKFLQIYFVIFGDPRRRPNDQVKSSLEPGPHIIWSLKDSLH